MSQLGYAGLLAQSQSIYQNVLSGYQSLLGGAAGQAGNIAAGYGSLGAGVQKTIAGVDASQRQAIADAYAQQSGQATQSLINSGLGNTTVTSAVARGLQFDKQKADIALSNQMAQLQAGYQAQIGMAGLGYQGQALGQRLQLGGQALQGQLGYAGALLGAGARGYGGQQAGGWSTMGGLGGAGGGMGLYGVQQPGSQSPYGGYSTQQPASGPPDPYVDLSGALPQPSQSYGGALGGQGTIEPWMANIANNWGSQAPAAAGGAPMIPMGDQLF